MPPGQLSSFGVNKLQYSDLPIFHPESLTPTARGKAMKFPVRQNDPIRVFGLPRKLLIEFRILSNPFTVVRDVTLTVLERLDAASERSSSGARMVLTGPSGCGKSVTLIQAVQYAAANNWLVFYFPRGIDTVNSSTSYVYDARTQIYIQPDYALQTLKRFLTVNSSRLRTLITQEDIFLDKRPSLPKGTPLTELIASAMKDQSTAPAILSALFQELGAQTQYPVLLAIDDFQALYCKSLYRDSDFSRIKSYHLSMPRLLLEYASGKKIFNRGAVLGAISTSHTSFPTPVELEESLKLSNTPQSPYIQRLPALVSYAAGLSKVAVPDQLNVGEAASLFDVWVRENALIAPGNDEVFLAKYTEASGNARDFVWKGLLSTLST